MSIGIAAARSAATGPTGNRGREADGQTIIATVAGRPITDDRLRARLAELRRGPRARHLPPGDGPELAAALRWIVRELVTDEILAHEAAVRGLDVGGVVAAVTGSARVADHEIEDFYGRNLDLYTSPETRTIAHLVVRTLGEARELARRPVELLERAVRREVGRGELAGELEGAIFAASVGDVVGPVRTGLGWHVGLVTGIRERATAPLPEVRARIEARLLADARRRTFDEWLEGRRRELAAVAPELDDPVGLAAPAGHRH